MKPPIRILEIVNIMDRAGLETMLMNHYRHIDRDLVQFDFLAHRPSPGMYDEEINSLGGQVYRAPRLYPQNCSAYRRYMRDFFSEHRYPVVHSHIDAMSAFPLAMARSCGVAARVAHSHSDSVDKDIKFPIKEIARKRLPDIATHYWACSETAGMFLFGEDKRSKIHVVKNAIDLEIFKFDPETRAQKRREIGIFEDDLLIGHVGRFCKAKNHDFIIDLISKLRKDGIDARLALVGDGELRPKMERKVSSLGLSDQVRFLGRRNDVNALMQAFDLLLFPSIHEGIPLTLIEAQASGLPVLASDKVSIESIVLSNSARLSLGAPIAEWASKAKQLMAEGRVEGAIDSLSAAGYEIGASAKELQSSYLSLYEEAVNR